MNNKQNRNKQRCLSRNNIVDPFISIAICFSVENNGRGNDFFPGFTTYQGEASNAALFHCFSFQPCQLSTIHRYILSMDLDMDFWM